MKRWLRICCAALALLLAGPLLGAIEVHEFDDPVQGERYRQFIDELRCPKCQNQNLAGSDAPIAQDLRRELARMLEEGRSDREIIDFMVQRYGDFVLYRPPLNTDTLALWALPLVMLLTGLLVIGRLLWRQRRRAGDAAALSADPLAPDQLARAERLLSAAPDSAESGVGLEMQPGDDSDRRSAGPAPTAERGSQS